ncbi:MAG: aminotransferase class III-fold pyridoxal phosphate-dependent enzyme, partial [Flavobacteriales bacterium]
MNDILLKKHLAQTTPFPMVIEVEKAQGSVITAKNGKEYIDMVSGLSVSNFGHGHARIKEAIHEQTEKHLHVMVYGEFRQDAQERCASNLCSLLPSSLDTVYFVNSGTEANEAAIKLAKR